MPVAARFHEIRDRVLAGVDQCFAEPVYVSFQVKGKVDPERPALTIEGVLRVGGGKQSRASNGAGESWRTQIAGGKAELHIDRAVYAGPAFQTGDRLRAVSRASQPWFEVLGVEDRGESRLVLELGEV